MLALATTLAKAASVVWLVCQVVLALFAGDQVKAGVGPSASTLQDTQGDVSDTAATCPTGYI
ncbi:MAG: hypothetical protein IPL33_15780 [Sphingobacteriales bacterium]|nr:hypothetical protein [Sphingobacteriales bacterium]